jgi:hypothetical protein
MATTRKTSKTKAPASKPAAEPKPKASAKPKASKKTAADLGVPSEYTGPTGTFKPGLDARLKSDLILRALDQPAPKALVQFTQAEAVKLLAKFPQWKPFLTKKKQALAVAAKKAAAKQEAK